MVNDRVLLTADRHNVEDVIDLAVEHNLGVEVMMFSYPDVLDDNWKHELATYRTILRRVPGTITMHGPFMDMVSGSPDNRINEVCIGRYRHALHIANDLEIGKIVLHPNFIGSLHNPSYREGWHKRNVIFWNSVANYATPLGVTIALENMWEFEPGIIADVLREVDHPNLRACLDVGHAHVFGDKSINFQTWLNTMAPWLVHMHMNNNNGILDEHHGFDWENGVLDYNDILSRIRTSGVDPTMVLEMWDVNDMRDSLHYFEIEKAPDLIGD
ncbi:MAG: sugar phosphate isomerase/epimerase family protein [Aggregatilineales bacterium]